MGRHSHDRAVAVGHEHIITDPDGDLLACEWVGNVKTRCHPFFFSGGDVSFCDTACLAVLDKFGKGRIIFCCSACDRMLRRDCNKGHAHDGVGPRGEDKHSAVVN